MKKQILTLTLIFLVSLLTYAQETYTIGNTEYYYGRTYETTGKPVVKRSEANKRAFLNSFGLNETPEGYEIDHIKPLSEGGTDDPSNMQLLTVEQHKLKTAEERTNRSNSTYYPRTYTSNSTYVNQYNIPRSTTTTTSSYSRTDSNGRTIYTGSRGGEYYINSSGNKVYVKSENSTTTSTNATSTQSYYSPSTSSPRTIQTGPRGGKYYINSKGNKTYVKKKNK
ncbi:MAG: HNH endonuclease [Flavobacteriaceae bacterium]|nr:HNH endonuclease [Flavobacteriaceae bacterium]